MKNLVWHSYYFLLPCIITKDNCVNGQILVAINDKNIPTKQKEMLPPNEKFIRLTVLSKQEGVLQVEVLQ